MGAQMKWIAPSWNVWPKAFRDSFLLTHESWPKVRDECERLMLGHFSSKNGDLHQRTELTAKQAQLFAALGLEPPPKILGIHPRA
ncbi:hypothetical protein ABS784_13225 [Geobacillus sp. G4]|nr:MULTISPECIES: hypothetical protein [Geobacillus]UPT59732.1 hypothetical protein GK107_10000 [Geobacillus thermoleovorans]